MAEVERGAAETPRARWSVWRIDDNGNTFLVRTHLERAEADRLVAEFTARGHKQMYWAEPESGRAKSSSLDPEEGPED